MCSYGSQTTKVVTTWCDSFLTAKIRRTALELQALIFFNITEVTEAVPKILINFIYALDEVFRKLVWASTVLLFTAAQIIDKQSIYSSFSHCGKIQRLRENCDLESNVFCILTTSTLLQSNSNFFFERLWGQDRALTFRQSSINLAILSFGEGGRLI